MKQRVNVDQTSALGPYTHSSCYKASAQEELPSEVKKQFSSAPHKTEKLDSISFLTQIDNPAQR